MRLTRFVPLYFVLLLAIGVLSAPLKATAQVAPPGACSWLTQGMAARVLGGDVTVEVHVADAREGSCNFVRVSDATISLKLEVSKSALPVCGADAMRLKGIGNEAQRCALPAADGRSVEKIASRVRDRFFTLIMTQDKRAADQPGDLQNDDLEQAAESVAGNLF